MPHAFLRSALDDPVAAAYRVAHRVRPEALWRRQARLARRAGLKGLRLVLSFDCDTERDAHVAAELDERLRELGVVASYAVPGELLLRDADTYGALAAGGAEFLNHGGRAHTVYDAAAGHNVSTLFYDQMSDAEVLADIREGHAAVTQLVGAEPDGFRVPHFGTYQRPRQLRYLHGRLAALGYRYSSSTLPLAGFRWGPAFRRFGLVELPVTGSAARPLEILDSWGYFAAPDRTSEPSDYPVQARAVAERLAVAGAGIISVYADPVHVHGRPEFLAAVEAWLEVATPSSYGEIVDSMIPARRAETVDTRSSSRTDGVPNSPSR